MQPTSTEQATLVATESEIFNTVACLQEQISQLGGTTNGIQDAQQQILSLNDEIKNEQANADIARDRVAYIRNPEQHTSFYESWFPMDRPMRLGSVPIFIGVIVFLFIFIVLILLALAGANITFQLPPAATGSNTFFDMVGKIPTIGWIVMVVLSIVVIYFVNRK